MQTMGSIDVGQQAPDFTLKGPGGMPVTLSEFRGRKNVILVFYPLAFSPVCAHQLPQMQYGVLNAARGYSGRALFVIDKQGRIVYKDVSANPGDPAQIPGSEGAIAALRGPGV